LLFGPPAPPSEESSLSAAAGSRCGDRAVFPFPRRLRTRLSRAIAPAVRATREWVDFASGKGRGCTLATDTRPPSRVRGGVDACWLATSGRLRSVCAGTDSSICNLEHSPLKLHLHCLGGAPLAAYHALAYPQLLQCMFTYPGCQSHGKNHATNHSRSEASGF